MLASLVPPSHRRPGAVDSGTVSDATIPVPAAVPSDQVDREAVVDLLGALAYGELTAFERLAADARLAPTLADEVALASMAAAEFAHFRMLRDHLRSRGADAEEAMTPYVEPLDAFHDLTAPADWPESLVKAYVGDGIGRDFYREIAAVLDPATRDLVLEVLSDTGYSVFAVDRVRAAIAADPPVAGRLALWARRLVGEALTQAQQVAIQRDTLARLVSGVGDPAAVAALFTRITDAHAQRMAALGLST